MRFELLHEAVRAELVFVPALNDECLPRLGSGLEACALVAFEAVGGELSAAARAFGQTHRTALQLIRGVWPCHRPAINFFGVPITASCLGTT